MDDDSPSRFINKEAAKIRLSDADKALCRRMAEKLVPAMRITAERLGYALGVHGSLERDIDVIACPWTSAAVPSWELAAAIQKTCAEVAGRAFSLEHETKPYFMGGCAGSKPHGRRTWVFHLGGGPYVDLSVMPRAEHEDPVAAREAFEALPPETPKPIPFLRWE